MDKVYFKARIERVMFQCKLFQNYFLSKNQEVLKLGEEIEARRKEEDERRALMHELHEGRVKELEEKVRNISSYENFIQ